MRHLVPFDRVLGVEGGGDESARGLNSAEVLARRERFGANDIVEIPPGRWRALAVETAKDPMLWFLIGTGGVYAALGEWTESIVLMLSILPLAGMDVFLHRRAQASTRALRGALASQARVVRDGVEIEVASEELVVGDLALVAAGDALPADGVLVECVDSQVDESSLTGESIPVRKKAFTQWPTNTGEFALDEEHWGFAGTRLLTGAARLRIVRVGSETLYGGIVRMAAVGSGERTPLQRSIASLVRVLVIGALALCVTLATVRLQQGHGWVDALLSAMTLAIAALPEEFPVVFAVFLGVGVHRLARRRALVRRALCVENIGRVSTICSDKTGTITEGVLELVETLPSSGTTRELLLTNAARASRTDTHDPLDRALLDRALAISRGDVIELYPFTEDRRRETVIVSSEGGALAATKGSPETILAACALSDDERRRWSASVDEQAALGRKVIACASLRIDATKFDSEPTSGLHFDGLLAFEDPPRAGVAQAIADCRAGGVRTILLTGDHAATALSIARTIGLGSSEQRLLLGDELASRLEADPSLATRIDVVARAMPAQKLALVRALQAAGEIVAVTGDGVNDAPALQAADIGIAMGQRGTRTAREAASIVLLDDDFSTIVHAIAEGRQLLINLRASFGYLLTIHLPLVLTAAILPLAGYPLVFLPIHIVWLELVIHPSAMLAFQVTAPSTHLTPLAPDRGARLITRRAWVVVLSVGGLLTGGIVMAYVRSLGLDPNVEHARSLALLALLVASVAIMALTSRMRTRAAWVVSALTLASVAITVSAPAVAARLHLAALGADDWGLVLTIVATACAPLVVDELRVRRGSAPARSRP